MNVGIGLGADGPTTMFKLSSLKLGQEIRGGATCSDHQPELILNNFNTRVGHRLGDLLEFF
jgi:ribosome production factor 1